MWKVIGHHRAVDALRRAVDSDHVPHALLLTGPAGIGKTHVALELAKAVNCEGHDRPDQTCLHCLQIEHGTHPDVSIIERLDGRDAILIQQVRELRDAASIRPFQARMKVYIVTGAEALTSQAADALLKTLEEPQAQVMLVLTAVDAVSVPPTVLSRCRLLALQPIDCATMERALIEAGAEKDRASHLARLAQGNVGWAISALSDSKLLARQEEMIGSLSRVFDLDLDARLLLAESLTAGKRDRAAIRSAVEVLVLLGRDLLLLGQGLPARLVTGPQQAALLQQARRLSAQQVYRYLEGLRLVMERIDSNVDPRLALEALLVGFP